MTGLSWGCLFQPLLKQCGAQHLDLCHIYCKDGCSPLTQSDAIGPFNVISHQHLSIHSIHPGLLYLGLRAPVRPVHEAGIDKGDTQIVISWTVGVEQLPSRQKVKVIHLSDQHGYFLPLSEA